MVSSVVCETCGIHRRFCSRREIKHDKSESNSKVIIRQTADADEHFFKALRQLKVDVSADIQTVDRRSSVGLIMGPEPASTTTSTAIGLLTNENRWDAHSSSTRLVQPKISKSATELAVEEHFEKSLAAFNASKRNKNCLVEVHRANSNACTMPLAVSVGTPAKEAARLSTMTPCPASLDMSAGKSCTQRSNIPCLVRQCAQDHTSPQLGSALLPTVDSPSYAPRTLLSPGPEECQSSNFSLSSSASLSRNNSFGMVNSPGESGSSTRVLQPVATCCASLPTTSSSNVSTNNSFKPKKNWLAQYDWRQDARDNSTLSLTASNCIVHGAVDSAGSSPASIGLELPDTNSTSNGHRWITSSNRAPLKSSRGENVIEHEVSVQTMESIGLSTDDRPITERKTRHSAEIQTDALLIHTLSENQDAFSDDGPQNFSNEVPSEDMRPTKILLLEKIRDDDALTRPPMDSTRCGEYPAQAGKQIQVQSKRFVKTLRRDLALSPIFQDHGISGETAAMEKGSGSDRSPQYQSDCVPPKSTECHELPTQFHPSHNDAISGSGSNARNGKCSLWGLSNSCSPSPAHQDGSATSAVTPVSGTTSGFFTGSTYSLDSSLGTAHTIPFDTKEVDSGIDLKSVSEERNFHPDHEALPDSDEAGRIPHPADLPGCAWGMRKRASSEASPWSTLKRSRSVLTSPLTGRVNCASCSSSSAELLLEAHVDETIGNTNSCRLRRLDGGSICRCCEGQNRPLTPDLNGSYAFDGHDRMLSPSESNSGLNDKCLQEENHKHFVGDDDDNDADDDDDENADQVLNERSRGVLSSVPELYPMHKTFTVCDYKQSSESTCLTQNRSGNRSIGRSLSDAGVIPILHLTKEKDVFVLR
ncbi:hypothetical protein D915_000614 [Fasciola hepatica]|uniref:Uncharacterized protein n=1 Tax=Fasciola hepatica TaxID=6192 RepID=A0A4E0RI77_FASHE|nr:hypothetical protein D915_000614 [Fasciola hepatica]